MNSYPKMLYRGGHAYTETGKGVPHQDTLVVNDEAEEAAAVADGFAAAQEAAQPGDADHAAEAEGAPQDVEPVEGHAETDAGSEAHDTLAGDEAHDNVEGDAGADEHAA